MIPIAAWQMSHHRRTCFNSCSAEFDALSQRRGELGRRVEQAVEVRARAAAPAARLDPVDVVQQLRDKVLVQELAHSRAELVRLDGAPVGERGHADDEGHNWQAAPRPSSRSFGRRHGRAPRKRRARAFVRHDVGEPCPERRPVAPHEDDVRVAAPR